MRKRACRRPRTGGPEQSGHTPGVIVRLTLAYDAAADEGVDLERLERSINGMLTAAIVALEVRRAPDGYDARFSASAAP